MNEFPPPPDLELALAHEGFVRAMAVGVLGGDADVDDVAQETWILALARGPREAGRLRAWLGGVSRRLALTRRRGAIRRAHRHAAAPRRDGPPDPAEFLAREETRRRVVAAVLALEEPYRGAILLRYLEAHSVAEVAHALGVPRETAKTRLRRGLALLRERLDAAHEGNRSSWALGLAPFVAPAPSAASVLAVAVAAGGLVGATALALTVAPWAPRGAPPDSPRGVLAEAPGRGGAREGAGILAADPLAARRAVAGAGSLAGRVVDATGRPVEGAQVEVLAPRDPASPWRTLNVRFEVPPSFDLGTIPAGGATTDAEGRYLVEGLAVGGYGVRVRGGGAVGCGLGMVRASGARGSASVVSLLSTLPLVEGRLETPEGTPAHGQVALAPDGQGMHFLGAPPILLDPVPLAADGTFRFEGVPAGRHALWFARPGCLAMVGEFEVPAPRPLEGRVPSERREATRRVISADDGAPVEGLEATAIVVVGGRGMGMLACPTLEPGRIAVPSDLRALVLRAPGFVFTSLEERGELVEPIRLHRSGSIALRVLAPSGEPAPAVEVVAEGARASPTFVVGSSDAAGRLTLGGLAPGEVSLSARGAAGWAAARASGREGADPLLVSVVAGGVVTGEVRLAPGAEVEALVVDAEGRPVAGAIVEARRLASDGSGPGKDAVGPFATETNGRVAFVGLTPDVPWEFTASAPGRVEGRARATGSTAKPTEVRLVLEAGRSVVVRAVDEAGAPLAGVRVELRPADPARGSGPGATTAANGRAEVDDVGPGALHVAATRRDVEFPEHVVLPEGPGREALVLVGKRRPTVAGVVLDANGVGVSGAQVELRTREGGRAVADEGRLLTEADGRFELLATEGDLEVWARVPAGAAGPGLEVRASVRGGMRDVRLVLAPRAATPSENARLELRVLDAAGRRVERAWIERFEETALGRHVTSGGGVLAGRASFTAAAGPAWFEVSQGRWEGASSAPLPGGATLVGPVPATASTLEIRLVPEERVEGRVVGPDGAPARGVLVRASPVRPAGWVTFGDDDEHARARTDLEGRFVLRGLGSGPYRLRFAVAEDCVAPPPLEVAAGARDLDVKLEAGLAPKITIVGTDGAPVAGAPISLWEARSTAEDRARRRGFVASGRTDPRGRLRVPSLVPTHRLRLEVGSAFDAGLPETSRPYLDEAWMLADTTVVLPRGFVTTGVVVDGEGRPVPEARLVLMRTEDGGVGVAVGPDGAFRLTHLPAGEVVLYVEVGDSPTPYRSRRVVLPAGEANARLVVDRGVPFEAVLADWRGKDEDGATAVLRWGKGERGGRRRLVADAEGRLRTEGLEADAEVELLVAADAAGRTAHRRGLRPGVVHPVTRELGLAIEGRARLPAGATDVSVGASDAELGAVGQAGAVDAEGRFRIGGVPPGRWSVSVNARVGQVWWHGHATAEAGGSVEVVVDHAMPTR